MCQSCQTWPAKFGQILLRTDTRLVFCNRKLMRTDIFFTRTTKPICNFANSIVLMFNININYTTARMDYAISARPSRTPIVIRGKSRWTQKSDRGNWFVVSSYKPRCPWWTAKKTTTLRVVIFLYSSRFVTSMHLFPERAECWMGYILLWILYLYLFVIHNLRDFFLKQHLLHDIVVGFIFKVMAQELLVFEWFCTCWCLRNELSVHKDGTCQSISIDQRPKITSLWYLERRQHIEMK